MQSVLFSTLKMLALICVGYFLRKGGHISESGEDTLSSIVTTAALPAYILSNVLSVDATAVLSSSLTEISLLSFGYYITAGVLLTLVVRRSKQPEAKKRLCTALCTFANAGFIGIPLIAELMGPQGALLATVSNLFYQLFFYTFGMYLLLTEGSLKESSRRILRVPVVWAALLALILFLMQVRLPALASDILGSLGGLCFPLSMLVIGCMLTHMPFSEIWKNREAYWVTAFRLLIAPALMLLAVRLLHIPEPTASAAVLLFGLPAGSMPVIYAKQSGRHVNYASCALVQSSALMLVSLPFWMWVLTVV